MILSGRNPTLGRSFCQWKNSDIETLARSHMDTTSIVMMFFNAWLEIKSSSSLLFFFQGMNESNLN